MTGSNRFRLDPGSSAEVATKWSPDGGRLAFLLKTGAKLHVAQIEPDGSGFRILGSTTSYQVSDLDWAPDGRSLVIVGIGAQRDPDTGYGRAVEMAWLMDVATGEEAEAPIPIDTWQRLAP